MIGGKLTEFMDKLYFGEELLFEYNGREYFIQGWTNDGLAYMVLDEQCDRPFEGYLWEYNNNFMRECADAFLSEKLWNGKSFLQIEKEVTWKD